ncbi:MAG: prepilin-type N-terminal cleavage/methylation domain-containing protein [Candidatus Omnitrophica bacterium]|nr:prepilin-type N-terminal cleavage/methylation domain-containing protein [Candidatus Omnitrophota bacterium]
MRKRGVTLIELLIGLSISGILFGMTMLSMSVLGRQRLTSETVVLSSNISWIRELAKTQRYNYFLSFNLSDESYSIYQDSDDDESFDVSDTLVKQQDMTADIYSFQDFGGNNLTPARIMFSKVSGAAEIAGDEDNEGALITIKHAGGQKEISIFRDTGYGRGSRRGRRSGCFIAAAAYSGRKSGTAGTGKKPEEVIVLEKFRDMYLSTNYWGREFERFYYTVSPPLADYIAERDWARTTVRVLLKPVVWGAKRLTGG